MGRARNTGQTKEGIRAQQLASAASPEHILNTFNPFEQGISKRTSSPEFGRSRNHRKE